MLKSYVAQVKKQLLIYSVFIALDALLCAVFYAFIANAVGNYLFSINYAQLSDCLFIALAVYNVVFLKDNEVLFVGLGGSFIFFVVSFMFLRNIIPKNKKCVKVQDGILNGVWKKTSGSASSSTVHYYLDVIFPLNGTRCRKIDCHEEDYKKGKVGSKVLVFSFNNTKGFGIVRDDI